MIMKKVLVVATVGCFFRFEISDIKILRDMGYEVHCASDFKSYEEHIAVKELKQMNDIVMHQIPFERSPLKKDNYFAYKKLIKLLDKERFDLVHCHTPVGGILTRIAANKYRKAGLKIIYTAHGFHFFKGAPLMNWIIYFPMEWFFSWFTDCLITINKNDYQNAIKCLHAKRVVYIPGVGIDVNKFSKTSVDRKKNRDTLGIPMDAFVLLSVGELSDTKNHQIVINALSKINNSDIYYLIAGSGSKEDDYKELIDKYSLNNRVKLLGQRDDIVQLCKIADCFVHPSIREGLGLAPLEAMAAGLPLISAYIGGIRDYTQNEVSGYCVNPRDVNEIIIAIERMYYDFEFRKMCAENNKIIVKDFDIQNTRKIMTKIYKEFDK